MKIIDLFKRNKPVVSCEIFPPKKEGDISSIFSTLDGLKDLMPDFISVTYGAGGNTAVNTVEICRRIIADYGLLAMAHFTCVGLTADRVNSAVDLLRRAGVTNILALRGDPPQGEVDYDWSQSAFAYANELIAYLAKHNELGIAAAAYPEGHLQSHSIEDDLCYLRQKVDAGADFLITQLFFDNDKFYRWRELAEKQGVRCPITVGVLPVLDAKQINRIVKLCGVEIPRSLSEIIAKHGDNAAEMAQAGIEYACEQITDLLDNGVEGIHLYTMNKPQAAKEIFGQTGLRKVKVVKA